MTDLLGWIGSGLGFDGAGWNRRRPGPSCPSGRRMFRRLRTARYDLVLADGPGRASSREILLVVGRG